MTEQDSSGLRIGAPAPDWTLPDAQGGEHTLAQSLGPRGAVLMFVRGMFCPYCTEQLQQLWEGAAQFRERQVRTLVITPYGPGAVAAALAGTSIPVLIDRPRQVIERYGLRHDVPDFAADSYPTGDLVHPTVVVLDAAGTVRWLYVAKTYSDRPRIQDVLHQLDLLAA